MNMHIQVAKALKLGAAFLQMLAAMKERKNGPRVQKRTKALTTRTSTTARRVCNDKQLKESPCCITISLDSFQPVHRTAAPSICSGSQLNMQQQH
jgi:hypothetical protein